MIQDFEDPTRDITRDRVFLISNGNKVHVTREDPYGFWYMRLEKGQLPEKLRGCFTTFEYAKQALTSFLNEKRQVIKEEISE